MSYLSSETEFSVLSQECIDNKKVRFTGAKSYAELCLGFSGTGIVIPGGGNKYGTNAYINIRYLIDVLKTKLPIELWYVGKEEYNETIFRDLKTRYGDQINIIDTIVVEKQYPYKGKLRWYPIKPFSIMHSRFETVLFLDADCFLYQQPEKILETNLFKEHEALFCTDIDLFYHKSGRLNNPERNYRVPKLGVWNQHTHKWIYDTKNPLWDILKIEEDDLPEFESGLICLNKTKHIEALGFALFLNENHDFIYNYICGDKDTFKLAWAKFGSKLNLIDDVRPGNRAIEGYLNGEILYQHRVSDAKFDSSKTLSEFPNNIPCHNKGEIKKIFKELSEIMGNDLFDSSYRQAAPISQLMPGSTKKMSQTYIDFVNNIILTQNIKTIIDIGCGDGLMLSHLDIPETTNLTGIDISSRAIEIIKNSFKDRKNFSFINIDAKEYTEYSADLVLIKDVFQHLPFIDIEKIIRAVEKKAKYIIIVNDTPTEYKDINRGFYRPVDITDIYEKDYTNYIEYGQQNQQNKCIVLYQTKEKN